MKMEGQKTLDIIRDQIKKNGAVSLAHAMGYKSTSIFYTWIRKNRIPEKSEHFVRAQLKRIETHGDYKREEI